MLSPLAAPEVPDRTDIASPGRTVRGVRDHAERESEHLGNLLVEHPAFAQPTNLGNHWNGHADRTPIAGLLCSRCPATVRRLVVAVDVFSVQRRSVRSWPHVSQERVERRLPAFAHADSSSAVVLVAAEFRVAAASSHRRPCVINGRSRVLHLCKQDGIRRRYGKKRTALP